MSESAGWRGGAALAPPPHSVLRLKQPAGRRARGGDGSPASQSSPSSLLPPGAGGDIGYTLADLDSIYRDGDALPSDGQDAFAAETFPRNDSPDDETQDVEVEELSPEHFAQVSLSQDSLDVILPPQMLNTNIFDMPDFPENFLENLDDEALNAEEPEPASPGKLVIDCPSGGEAPPGDALLPQRPQYMLELPPGSELGPNIFDDDSDEPADPADLADPAPHNVIELNILEPNMFPGEAQRDATQPNIFDEDRPEPNLLVHNIIEPNLEQNARENEQDDRD